MKRPENRVGAPLNKVLLDRLPCNAMPQKTRHESHAEVPATFKYCPLRNLVCLLSDPSGTGSCVELELVLRIEASGDSRPLDQLMKRGQIFYREEDAPIDEEAFLGAGLL